MKPAIPIQTLCAINHLDFRQRGTYDYSQLLMTASTPSLDDNALDQILPRMAFNVMARNCDDHTKNFGFIWFLRFRPRRSGRGLKRVPFR